MQAAGREVDVLVKVDVGFHRCGIDPETPVPPSSWPQVADAAGPALQRAAEPRRPRLRRDRETEVAAIAAARSGDADHAAGRLEAARGPVEEISVGATPTARFSARRAGITELRPGNYIYYDRMQVGLGAATWDDCALTVLARVVSRPAADRVILDCGSKTLTTDLARGSRRTTAWCCRISSVRRRTSRC